MSHFDVTTEPSDGAVLLRVEGELDIGAVPRLQGAVADVRARQVPRAVIDLRSCTFIDSTGTRALGAASRDFADDGLELSVCCPPSNRVVRSVLDLLGLDQVVRVVDDLHEGPGTAG